MLEASECGLNSSLEGLLEILGVEDFVLGSGHIRTQLELVSKLGGEQSQGLGDIREKTLGVEGGRRTGGVRGGGRDGGSGRGLVGGVEGKGRGLHLNSSIL